MWNAFLIMLVATAITVITGLLIAVLIQLLCQLVRLGTPVRKMPDDSLVALAIAVARTQNGRTR